MPQVEAPPQSPDQDELEALIEEARRRARRRRLGYLALVAGALALAGGLYLAFGGGGRGSPGEPAPGEQPLPSAAADGLRVRLQPGWHEAGKILVPKLLDPRERLSVGTFRMRPGGSCDIAPTLAYSDMRPTDGLITILERTGKSANYPPRPVEIRLHPEPRAFECAPPRDLNTDAVAFRDRGRIIDAFVALGARGPETEAESILNSLRVSPSAGNKVP